MQLLTDSLSHIQGLLVLVRTNYDVPLENQKVGDTTRIEDSLETIHALNTAGAKIILLAHAGRPNGQYKAEDSFAPVAKVLSELGGFAVNFVPYANDIASLKNTCTEPVNLIDNLRFWPGEEKNDPNFTQNLASLGSAYVNESFAVCHRSHASMVGLPGLLPAYAGISLAKELDILRMVTHNPKRPLVVIIGGAKLETKEPLVAAFIQSAEKILVGGKLVKDLKEKGGLDPKIHLADLTKSGKDITEASARAFAETIMLAGTVVWNGTMGVFEEPEHSLGTKIVAEAINKTSAFTLVGGGDTETCLTELNLESGIDHISSGGGAMLEFLSKGRLVAVDALL